jgi:hypothetical protein
LHTLVLTVATSLLLTLAAAGSGGTTHHVTPADDWLGLINGEGLNPGDTVVMHNGTYSTPDATILDIAHVGTASEPIVIRAASGETPIVTRNTFGAYNDYYTNLRHNVINMRGAQHVVLDGLEITGGNWGVRIGSKTNGQNITPQLPMGEIVRPAHHITLQNCHIHHTHNTAVSANFPGDVYDGLVIRGNDIHHSARWGESIYFGNYSSTGAVWGIVKNSVIENNHLHDNVWVNSWYQDPHGPTYHGTAIQLKDGCYNNVIRGNVMHYTRYPAVLISGAQSGFGSQGAPDWGPNIVEGNVVWQVSQAPNDITGQGMQIAADAIVRDNIVYAPQPFFNGNHQALAGDLIIQHNTFLSSTSAEDDTLRIQDVPFAPITIANNALYRGPGRTDVISGPGSASPLVAKIANVAILDLGATLGAPAGLDFFPLAGSALIGAADPAFRSAIDFNGTSRIGDLTVGAYVFDPGGNPGWQVQSGFKDPALTGARYCTAGASASGCRATITAAGIPSASASTGFDLAATDVEGAKDGLFFFGSGGRQANPWGNGTSLQCVVPPVSRTGVLVGTGSAGSCEGAFALDLNALWCPTCPKSQKNPGAGVRIQAQLWYRDPQNSSNQTTSLSDAIEFTVGS